MKLEKREITLNESDSLKDALYMQKILLNEYVFYLPKATRKETRGELLRLIKEVAEDMFFAADLVAACSSGADSEA